MSVADDLLNPDLSPEAGAALQKQAGMLICLDLPPGTQLGLDYADWTVGARFRGVSLLPPGIHFVWFRYNNILRLFIALPSVAHWLRQPFQEFLFSVVCAVFYKRRLLSPLFFNCMS